MVMSHMIWKSLADTSKELTPSAASTKITAPSARRNAAVTSSEKFT